MMWCPKCGTEYRDGSKTCCDCDSELVDNPENIEKSAKPQYDKEAFLIAVGDSIEADMVEALLNANQIPVLKKYREAGDYLKIYMGGTNFGVDLYVPSKLLSKAQELITSYQESFIEAEGLQDGEMELQDGEQQAAEEAQGDSNGQQDDDLQEYSDGQQDLDSQENCDIQQVAAENLINPDEETQDTENGNQTAAVGTEDTHNKKRRIRTWIILLFFIPGLIWIILALVFYLSQ